MDDLVERGKQNGGLFFFKRKIRRFFFLPLELRKRLFHLRNGARSFGLFLKGTKMWPWNMFGKQQPADLDCG